MIAVPPPVAAKARAVGAAAWLADLPDLIAACARQWQLQVGAPYPDATEAFVAPATRADGTAAVLKLLLPRDARAADHELTVLRLADGDGCVRLLAADEPRGALLLERLGPSMADLGLPMTRRHELLCDLAARVWRPAADAGLPSGADKAAWLAETIVANWHALGRPCSERAVAHALECAERRGRAHDPDTARLVHGDVHQWNALQKGDGFALVDPDGLFAEPEYDLGIIMREDPVELLRDGPWQRAEWLAARTGRDVTAIWEWGVVERVSTGLLGTAIGMQPIAAQMLAAADADRRGGGPLVMARVLVADNDREALDLAVLDLRLEGHEVAGVTGGEEALAAIDSFDPDVVVLDHRMPPGPSGLAVALRLRRERPDLRVVVYSNYQDVELLRSAARAGIAFLPKGNLRTLRAAVAG